MDKTRLQWMVIIAIVLAFVAPLLLLTLKLAHNSPKDHLQEYLNRIAKVQQAEVIDWQFDSFDTPHRRSLFVPIERLSIGLIESTELRKCDLLEMVYLHNDALGKVQDQFRNFDYQVQILVGLEQCLKSKRLSSELDRKLGPIMQLKWQQLPDHLRNTLFYAQASHKQLFSERWLDPNQAPDAQFYRDYSHLITSLLTEYQNSSLPVEFTLTHFQEQLEKQRQAGELYYSLFHVNQWLKRINEQLDRYPLELRCNTPTGQTQMETMSNVFAQFYVEKLQPYFAHLGQHYNAMYPMLQLYSTPLLKEHYDYPLDSEYQQFKANLNVHVEHWTYLREQCGMTMTQLISGSGG